jgi:hypothetical protein
LSRQLRRKLKSDEFSCQIVLAELYRHKTFYASALRLYEQLHKQRPDVRWLAQRIATTRQTIGLPSPEK